MRADHPEYRDTPENREHVALGIPPVARATRSSWYIPAASLIAASLLIAGSWWWLAQSANQNSHWLIQGLSQLVQSPGFWLAVAVGFSAQMIDGALGMAYGISSTTFLIGTGASPAAASGAVHIAEIFTTGFSGAAHLRLGNVDKALFRKIVVPGVIGGVAGAYVLTSIDGSIVKPYVSAYLLIMGLYILHKAWRGRRPNTGNPLRHAGKLAVSGGFLDAVGGGGWGPIVTSTLVGRGHDPRTTIGSVNAAEFFVTLATGGAFLLFGKVEHWTLVAGLIFGGLFAAPVAAHLTSRISARTLLWMVGGLISLISLFNLYKALA